MQEFGLKIIDGLLKDEQEMINGIQYTAKKDSLMMVATFPFIMLACYLGLILYFQTQGGYKPKILISQAEENALMTGGAESPAEMEERFRRPSPHRRRAGTGGVRRVREMHRFSGVKA